MEQLNIHQPLNASAEDLLRVHTNTYLKSLKDFVGSVGLP